MTTSTLTNNTFTSGNVWQKGIIAAVVATLINLVLFAIGSFAGGLSVADMANPGLYMPVPWFMVILMTFIPVLLGTVVFWLLRRFLPNQATRIFVIGALALAVLSAFGPLMAGETMLPKILLALMHLVAGGSLVWFVTR